MAAQWNALVSISCAKTSAGQKTTITCDGAICKKVNHCLFVRRGNFARPRSKLSMSVSLRMAQHTLMYVEQEVHPCNRPRRSYAILNPPIEAGDISITSHVGEPRAIIPPNAVTCRYYVRPETLNRAAPRTRRAHQAPFPPIFPLSALAIGALPFPAGGLTAWRRP